MLLQVNNIQVIYEKVIMVLRGLSLKVPEKSIIALLGSNGAGKTTTLKAISGLLKPENGEVTQGAIIYQEQRIDGKDPAEIVRLGISQVMEGRRVFEELTVEENLATGLYIRKDRSDSKWGMESVYHYFPALKELRKQVAGYLSGGEQQMLVIARALLTQPKLLLLDEPSLGLAPLIAMELFEIIKRINQERETTILLVEQNAQLALSIASWGYIMENGQIVLDGPSAEVRENRNVREFYLGLNEKGERKSFRDVKHYTRKKRWFSM